MSCAGRRVQPWPVTRYDGEACNSQQPASNPERQQAVQIAQSREYEGKDHIDGDPSSGAEEHQHICQTWPQKMIKQVEQIAVHMLEKNDGNDKRSECKLIEVDANPKGDEADDPVDGCLNAPIAAEHTGNFIELLRDCVAAHDTDQSKAGDNWKHDRSAGNEAVDPQRIEADKSGDEERKGELRGQRQSAQPHDRQRRQCAATQCRI